MAEHIGLGARGEQLACQHLEGLGFTILHRNWRHERDELDIVARQGDELVVVEVKTRATLRHGDPEEAVGILKQRRLVRAAEAYADAFGLDLDTRFDIVSVVIDPHTHTALEIFHIPEAFYPAPEDEAIEE